MLRHLRQTFGGSKESEPKVITKQQIQTAYALMDAWSKYCEGHNVTIQIIDQEELPYPKAAILNAMLIVASVEKDLDRMKALRTCGPFLAYFQPDVGKEVLWPTGADTMTIATCLEDAQKQGIELQDDTVLWMTGIVNPDPDNLRRYQETVPSVKAEFAHIGDLLDRVFQSRFQAKA